MNYNLEAISEKLIESINDILDEFGIKYTDYGDRVSFSCPIHDGDNPEGCSILKRGVGNWKCFTHNCHEEYGSSILNFIQALLEKTDRKDISFYATLKWCAGLVGEEKTITPTEIQDQKTKTEFIQLLKYAAGSRDKCPTFYPRQRVREGIKIPAKYYIDRGFCPEILTKYDVGLCDDSEKSMYNRVVIPIYDDDGKYMIGCSGRSVFEQCVKCQLYHDGDCPTTREEKKRCSKWKHSYGFDANKCLYNYWEAKKHILETKTAVLVEGPGDIWKLEEADVHTGLAIFGSFLSDTQTIILEESGAWNIVIVTDNDEAGEKARKRIENKLNRSFNIFHIQTDQNDLGDSNIFYIRNNIMPVLENIYEV